MKLVSKERHGSKVVKKYDEAKTPCQRVLASPKVSKTVKRQLRAQFARLDPVKLLAELERLQDELWQYAYEPAQSLDNGVGLSEAQGRWPLRLAPVAAPFTITSNLAGHSGREGNDADQSRPESGASACEAPLVPRRSQSERRYRKKKRKGRYHLVKRTWRTRPDPFADVWAEVEAELQRQPHLEAKRLFQDLQWSETQTNATRAGSRMGRCARYNAG